MSWQDIIAISIVIAAAVLLTRPWWSGSRKGGACDHCDCGSRDNK